MTIPTDSIRTFWAVNDTSFLLYMHSTQGGVGYGGGGQLLCQTVNRRRATGLKCSQTKWAERVSK